MRLHFGGVRCNQSLYAAHHLLRLGQGHDAVYGHPAVAVVAQYRAQGLKWLSAKHRGDRGGLGYAQVRNSDLGHPCQQPVNMSLAVTIQGQVDRVGVHREVLRARQGQTGRAFKARDQIGSRPSDLTERLKTGGQFVAGLCGVDSFECIDAETL